MIPEEMLDLADRAASCHTDGWEARRAREQLAALRQFIDRVLDSSSDEMRVEPPVRQG